MKKFIQVKTKRSIPDMNSSLLFFLKNDKKNPADYENEMKLQETKLETDLILFLQKMNIYASTKSDRYSLPIEYEIVQSNQGVSFLNETFSTFDFYRQIAKALINAEIYKIRFYTFIEIKDNGRSQKNSHRNRRVNYYFRYYVH